MRRHGCTIAFALGMTLTATAQAQDDTGPTDAAPPDAAPPDAGPTDAAPTAPTDAVPTDAVPTDAGRLIDEGVELRREGDEEGALERFERAHALDPSSPRALAQMALAEKSLRRYLQAEAHLEVALAETDDAWVNENRAALERARELVARQLGWIEIESNVGEAQLRVDGEAVADLPLEGPVRVLAGERSVEVRADGYAPAVQRVTIAATETKRVSITLEAAPQVEPSPDPAPPPAATERPPETPAPATSWTPLILGVGAAGFVGLAVGAGLGVHVLALKDDRDALCNGTSCLDERAVAIDGEARIFARGSTAAFAIGGTAAVAALVLWLVAPDPDAQAWLEPGGGGVRLRF